MPVTVLATSCCKLYGKESAVPTVHIVGISIDCISIVVYDMQIMYVYAAAIPRQYSFV